jgi:hypothetical protein
MRGSTVDRSRGGNKSPQSLRAVACLTVGLLAAPPAFAKDPLGRVAVHVVAAGIPACRVSVSLLNEETGALLESATAENGTYELSVPPGRYRVAVRDKQGRQILKAPREVSVSAGRMSRVEIALAYPGAPEVRPASLPSALPEIQHRNVTCLVAGRESGLIAVLSPGAAGSVVFRTGTGRSGAAELAPFGPRGALQARVGPFTIEDGSVEYSIEATNATGTQKSPPVTARVVERDEQCGACDDVVAAAYPAALFLPAAAAGAGVSPLLGALGIIAAGGTAAAVVDSGNASPSR